MQDTLHALPPSGRSRPLPRVVDGRFRVSRADALHDAHASLQEAEENLRHLAARALPTVGGRPPLFRRR